MTKFGLFLIFLPAAMLAAGLLGAIHGQMAYTLAPEYFTKAKFLQYGLQDTALPERIRASLAGFLDSWWIGFPMGLLCGAAGFMQRSPALMRRALVWPLPATAAFVLTLALAGLACGLWRHGMASVDSFTDRYPAGEIVHLRQYICVTCMHIAAYAGGVLSIPAAWAFHFALRAPGPAAR